MALDNLMLQNFILKGNYQFALRFYSWKGNWLSLGRNQKNIPTRWLELSKEKKINLVFRPSGGTAVLHGGGLTYAIAWKSPPKKRKHAYLKTSKWLIESFQKLGLSLKPGNQPSNINNENCFSSSTSADLTEENNIKRIGSAQFWKKGSVLQHGEIILRPQLEIWGKLFKTEPPRNLNLPPAEIEESLFKTAKKQWNYIEWEKYTLTKENIIEIYKESNNFIVT